MTISEQIKILCVRCNMSEAELARRLGKSPQSFNAKMKRESFTIDDLNEIAEAVGVEFKRNFMEQKEIKRKQEERQNIVVNYIFESRERQRRRNGKK